MKIPSNPAAYAAAVRADPASSAPGGLHTHAFGARQNSPVPAETSAPAAPARAADAVSVLMLSDLLSLQAEGPENGRIVRAPHLKLRHHAALSWTSRPGDALGGPATSTEIAAQLVRNLGSGQSITAEDAKRALAPKSSGIQDSVRDLIGRYVTDHDRDRSGGLDVAELRDLIDRIKSPDGLDREGAL